MSSAPVLHPEPEATLSHDEWWTLFDQLRLSQQKDYAEHDGAATFIRHERDADLS